TADTVDATNTADAARPRVNPGSIGAIVRAFKSATTKRINALRGMPGAPVWQRNYYERIIRTANARHHIRQYIVTNPARWLHDRDNPLVTLSDLPDT
ncbi:MAG: transposase, partial [Chloracidobacterium sp.]